jgi:hypothetical protein
MPGPTSLREPSIAAIDNSLSGILKIDDERLLGLATELAGAEMEVPDWRLLVYPQADDDRFVQFIGVQNALNFCFFNPVAGDKFAAEYRGEIWGGSTGLCAALMRAIEADIDVLDPKILASLRIQDAEEIFASAAAPLPLLAERVAMLNSLGASLAPYDGSFANLVRAADFDAGRLISRLVNEFPAYGTDFNILPKSHEIVVFDKRARLFAIIYEGRSRGSKTLPPLSCLDQIGLPADYQIPRYLRSEGVLVYGDALAEKVDTRTLIAPGSVEEIVLRSSTNEVCLLLVDAINERRSDPITMIEVDFAMWMGGRRATGHHHLTLTTAY